MVSYGEQQIVCRLFWKHNLNPILRLDEDGRPLTTDNGNNIIDLHLDTIPFPEELATWLSNQVGVVRYGLF